MFKKLVLILTILGISCKGFAQKDINNYKYVVVPLQFEFSDGKDKYRTSTLVRYLFKKENFEVYFDEEELPEDLFRNRCLGMYVDVIKLPGIFKNKIQIELKDCKGKQIFLSDIGTTKVKEYAKAYPIAIREAFKSIEFLNYKYDASSKVTLEKEAEIHAKIENTKESNKEAENAKAEVERLKKEVEALKRQRVLEKTKAETDAASKKIEAESIKKGKMLKEKSEVKSDLLYAQPIEKGFQLVDASPKIIMILYKTAAPNVYAVKGKNAIVFKEGDKWFYSENDTKKELNIKF
ncbi:cell envelope integrity protein TolA [Winogradskyella haliclonae]|uniref:Conjugal transfer protein n=1 Tax=Winogradskyella haliclonae TaxID=2048558 RepID=A0ABQ2C222_9FLAO|nr:cell envelope integrity protein TolA [Winogradskyella haliclonae]GGI58295.1 hypothetical protein GCM10011444_26040 [Winogradskyella haliclonae]